MVDLSTKCTKCQVLNDLLSEKIAVIKSLEIEIEKLTNKLLNYDEQTCNSAYKDNLNFEHCKTVDASVQTDDMGFNENAAVNNESFHDFVYDEKMKMYYSQSTGYYYDSDKGLLYDPYSKKFYKYDYCSMTYVSANDEENQSGESPAICCETVLDQVNNLKLDDDEKYDKVLPGNSSCKVSIMEDYQDTADGICKRLDKCMDNKESLKLQNDGLNLENSEFHVHLDQNENTQVNLKTAEDDILDNKGSTQDWQLPEGSNVTISDLVREAVEEHYGMSDYVYDEQSKMYYSPSTGYYYDSKSNLLYDPTSASYYTYDEVNQSYQFFCKADVKSKKKSKCASKNVKRKKTSSCEKKGKKEEDSSKIDANDVEKNYSSPEEGEILSDSESSNSVLSCGDFVEDYNEDSSESWPPCIRAIVEESEKLKIGSLLLITCTGGIIGRDKNNAVHIPDISVSKIHAKITYDSESWKYQIEDLGSQRGTFLNNQRLSECREKSQPSVLNHGDRLCLGSCKLMLHIHERNETCDKCEPGQVIADTIPQEAASANVFKTKKEKDKERREELKKIKMKYGLQHGSNEKNSTPALGYEDKAEIRRKTVGSDNPYEKDEEGTSINNSLSSSNKGYELLKKMGWKEGQSLGTKESGLVEPLFFQPWTSKAGFGSKDVPIFDQIPEDKKRRRWVKAQERYLKLQ